MRNEAPAVLDCGAEKHDLVFPLAHPHSQTEATAAPSCKPQEAIAQSGFFRRLFRTVVGRIRERKTRNSLLELNDDQLKDIGLSRCQAYGGYSRYRLSGSARLEKKCG